MLIWILYSPNSKVIQNIRKKKNNQICYQAKTAGHHLKIKKTAKPSRYLRVDVLSEKSFSNSRSRNEHLPVKSKMKTKRRLTTSISSSIQEDIICNCDYKECNDCLSRQNTGDYANFRSKKRNVRNRKGEELRNNRQIIRNERERSRKARLNTAFNVLRNVLLQVGKTEWNEPKYTQLEVLRFASVYISHLTNVLDSTSM